MSNKFSGTVSFEISGINISRFVSRCADRGIEIEDIHYISSATTRKARVRVATPFVKQMLKTAGECRLRVHTVKRRGTIFFIRKHKSRWVLMYGWAVAMLFMLVLSHFVLFVEVKGINRIDEAHMTEILQEVGLKRFMFINRTEINEKADKLNSLYSDIASATVSVRGVKMLITVQETEADAENSGENGSRNLYARCDGVIEEILTYSGRAAVKKGDIVKKGDLLISGDMTHDEKTVSVYAKGKVTAHIAYTFYSEAGPELPACVRSGKSEERTRIEICGFGTQKTTYKKYEIEEEEGGICLNFIPVRWTKVRVYELTDGFRKANDDELKIIAVENVNKTMSKSLDKDAKIISKNTSCEKMPSGSVCATLRVITEENIIDGG